jgi:flagellar hook assembly protein FlgD
VELEIFTLSGRMIKSFRSGDVPLGRNRRFLWDGRDLDGDRVAQGVYLYKITAKGRSGFGTQSSDTMTETFGKLIVLN